jgi:hypothetical protein
VNRSHLQVQDGVLVVMGTQSPGEGLTLKQLQWMGRIWGRSLREIAYGGGGTEDISNRSCSWGEMH